jgi:predicted metal-dependent hydrolase
MVKKLSSYTVVLNINDAPFPVEVHREVRNNVRASMGKNKVHLRVPYLFNQSQIDEYLHTWLSNWLKEKTLANEKVKTRYGGKGYEDGMTLMVGKKEYLLKIAFNDLKTHTAQLKNNVITLQLAQGDTELHRQKAIRHLLSRVVAKDQLPDLQRRVYELNHLHFQKEIKSISLKYNQSNWGSCSSSSNLNFSTRLLFAPDDVIDYVIIHELSHLIELNHSDRFWKLVETAMPNYREKEKWLVAHREECNF